jgi:uncharacterized protein (AIM24 family)
MAAQPFSAGGKLIGPCERENWSKQKFEQSGAYALEGAIAPVEINFDRRTGAYEEPNVWVAYEA